MTFQPLTRSVSAAVAIDYALTTERQVRTIDANRVEALKKRATAITNARAQGVSLKELAQAFGKSIEWVRQAEKKGQAK